MKIKGFVLISLMACFFVGCTENVRSRHWGGTANINLPPNKKLINATWKDANLWLLTGQMRTNEFPETYEFKEISSWGVFQGTIVIRESK